MRPVALILLLLDASPRSSLPPGVVASWTFTGSTREQKSGRPLELVGPKATRDGLALSAGYAVLKDDKVGALSGSGSIEVWVKFDSFRSAWSLLAMRGVQGRRIGESFGLYVGNTGQVYFNANRTVAQSPRGAITAGVWAHVVAVVDARDQQMRVHVNGEEVARGAIAGEGFADRGGPIYIGGCDIFDYNIDGTMRRLRLYNRALSAKEIQRLSKAK